MRRIISILVENEPGALSRIAGLFSARGYNIESLTVAPTDDDSLSRMTIVTHGSEQIIEQITKQLNKLIDVVRLLDLTEGRHIERELMLLKVAAGGGAREEIKRLKKRGIVEAAQVRELLLRQNQGPNQGLTPSTQTNAPTPSRRGGGRKCGVLRNRPGHGFEPFLGSTSGGQART